MQMQDADGMAARHAQAAILASRRGVSGTPFDMLLNTLGGVAPLAQKSVGHNPAGNVPGISGMTMSSSAAKGGGPRTK